MQFLDEIEQGCLNLKNSLSEKDERRYAAIEAKKLGHRGALKKNF